MESSNCRNLLTFRFVYIYILSPNTLDLCIQVQAHLHWHVSVEIHAEKSSVDWCADDLTHDVKILKTIKIQGIRVWKKGNVLSGYVS